MIFGSEYDDGDFDDDNYYEPLKIVPAHEGHVMDLQFSQEMDFSIWRQ